MVFHLRNSIIYYILLTVLVTGACNFPIKELSGLPVPSKSEFIQTRDAIELTLRSPAIQTPEIQIPELRSTEIPQTLIPAYMPGYDPYIYDTYTVQSGDTLYAVAERFGVSPYDILSPQPLPREELLTIDQILAIPRLLENTPYSQVALSDREVVNSPCGQSFDVYDYVRSTNGVLNTFRQTVNSDELSGEEIVKLVSENTSVNPLVLLAFIEFRSHWVNSNSGKIDQPYPLGMETPNYKGLFLELSLSAKLINMGYYGWRQGKLIELPFKDGGTVRIAPQLNAGTVGLQYLFARIYRQSNWENALYGPEGFLSTYQAMYNETNPCVESDYPIFPDGMKIPYLELPFSPGEKWALTGGLHSDWNTGTPQGALDFAPITGEVACSVSHAWVLASALGMVTRSENGVLTLALVDDFGNPTGWVLLYMHIAEKERVSVGDLVKTNDPIGHPSCEGGAATGTHVHLARLYRGEWIGAGNPFPLILSGWMAIPGDKPFQSYLIKGDQVVVSNVNGSGKSTIIR